MAQTNTNTRPVKKVVYTADNNRVVVKTFDFEIAEGSKAGTVIPMIEITTKKMKWNKDRKINEEIQHFVSMSKDAFVDMVSGLTKKTEEPAE